MAAASRKGPNDTPVRPIRVSQHLWDAFGKVAEPNRTVVLIDFMRWYAREPDAKPPRRPDQQEVKAAPDGP